MSIENMFADKAKAPKRTNVKTIKPKTKLVATTIKYSEEYKMLFPLVCKACGVTQAEVITKAVEEFIEKNKHKLHNL